MDTTYEDALESTVKNNEEVQNIFDTVVRLLKTFICFQSEHEAILLANYVVSTYFYKQFNLVGTSTSIAPSLNVENLLC